MLVRCITAEMVTLCFVSETTQVGVVAPPRSLPNGLLLLHPLSKVYIVECKMAKLS